MKNITYDIHSFKWDINSNTFYGDAWNLYEVGSYYRFPFPNGKKQFYIKNFGTHRFRRFRFVKELKIDYTDQWLFESEDGIKCMVKINKNIMKTIGEQIKWDFKTNGDLLIKDKNDEEIYFETSNEYWKKWEYDSENNLTYSENSVGDWERWEYDSQGNRIYFENSNGFWYKKEYDSQGNDIYFEDLNGYWVKREYDSQGNQIYFENSYGRIIDNQPKPCEDKVIEIEGVKYKLVKV